VADAFWEHLDSSKTEMKLDYNQFVSFLRPFVVAAFKGDSWANENKVHVPEPHPDDRIEEVRRDFADTLSFVGKKAKMKWSNLRHAFRFVNREKMGMITRSEMISFFRAFNIEDDVAEAFHARLDFYRTGDVLFEDFSKCMAPYLAPDVVQRKPAQLTAPQESTSDALNAEPQPQPNSLEATFQGTGTWNPSTTQMFTRSLDPAFLQELPGAMQEIGEKIAAMYKQPRDAFRPLDLQRDGHITRKELRNFFRRFNKTDEFADKIFDLLDPSGAGSIEFSEFLSHFDGVLNPSYRNMNRAAVIPVGDVNFSTKVQDVVNAIGSRLITKYKTVQDAFRDLDLNKDQKASKEEIQIWTKKMGVPQASADAFHEAMQQHWDDTGCVPKRAFVAFFRDLRGETESGVAFKLPRLAAV